MNTRTLKEEGNFRLWAQTVSSRQCWRYRLAHSCLVSHACRQCFPSPLITAGPAKRTRPLVCRVELLYFSVRPTRARCLILRPLYLQAPAHLHNQPTRGKLDVRSLRHILYRLSTIGGIDKLFAAEAAATAATAADADALVPLPPYSELDVAQFAPTSLGNCIAVGYNTAAGSTAVVSVNGTPESIYYSTALETPVPLASFHAQLLSSDLPAPRPFRHPYRLTIILLITKMLT